MHVLLLFVLQLVFVSALPAQSDPPVWSQLAGDAILSTHASGELSVSCFLADEGVVLSSTTGAVQGGPPPDPLPMLTTSWVDADGVTHTVSTPVASPTPAGIQRAINLHDQLVQLMRLGHPPAPVPPPPIVVPPGP